MADPAHIEKLSEGVEAWNRWRREHPDSLPDLGQADLREASLERVDFRGVRLWRADLSGADLTRADLGGANLRLAVLENAKLHKANLRATVFVGTRLAGAELHGAKVWRTRFCALDLSRTRGLETLSHHGPSTVGLDTLIESGPSLPDAFLRGTGVPDWAFPHIKRICDAKPDSSA